MVIDPNFTIRLIGDIFALFGIIAWMKFLTYKYPRKYYLAIGPITILVHMLIFSVFVLGFYNDFIKISALQLNTWNLIIRFQIIIIIVMHGITQTIEAHYARNKL